MDPPLSRATGRRGVWPAVARPSPRRRASAFRHALPAYLFILPTFLFLGYFTYVPVFTALTRAFTDWDGFNTPHFVGLSNFARVFSDPIMGIAAHNSLIWAVCQVGLALIPAFVVAELIFHVGKPRLQYAYRTLFVIPVVVPFVVTVLLWRYFYQGQGLLNLLLKSIGLGALQQGWLYDPHIALYSLIFIGFPWVDAFGLLILYAGLQGIPGEVLEAAGLDGATGLRRIWLIDLPLIVPQIRLLLILAIINSLQNIVVPLVMTNGGPGNATFVPALQMYTVSTVYDQYGYGMAISVVLFVIILALTTLNARVLRPR